MILSLQTGQEVFIWSQLLMHNQQKVWPHWVAVMFLHMSKHNIHFFASGSSRSTDLEKEERTTGDIVVTDEDFLMVLLLIYIIDERSN